MTMTMRIMRRMMMTEMMPTRLRIMMMPKKQLKLLRKLPLDNCDLYLYDFMISKDLFNN